MYPQAEADMDVEACIEGRTSVRDFKQDPVDDNIVQEALRLANLAPSAGNLQARDFVVVRDITTKKALADAAYHQDFVRTAPVVIVCCANLERIRHYQDRGETLYCIQDVAAAVENLMLFLFSKGIGSVWIGAFEEARASAALSLPRHSRPVAIVPIGYPSEKGLRRKRLPQSKIVHNEKW
jgi:nitroreductase